MPESLCDYLFTGYSYLTFSPKGLYIKFFVKIEIYK